MFLFLLTRNFIRELASGQLLDRLNYAQFTDAQAFVEHITIATPQKKKHRQSLYANSRLIYNQGSGIIDELSIERQQATLGLSSACIHPAWLLLKIVASLAYTLFAIVASLNSGERRMQFFLSRDAFDSFFFSLSLIMRRRR